MGVEANQQPLTLHRRKVSTIASGFVATSPSWPHTFQLYQIVLIVSQTLMRIPVALLNTLSLPAFSTFPAKEVALSSGKSRSFVVR